MANDILLRKFPNIKLTALTGGYTNSTILLEGSNPLVIAKIFNKNNNDAKSERNTLTLLNHSGVSPRIHDYFEDDTSSYIIMDYIRGINGQRFLDQGDMDKAREIYKLLGVCLSSEINSIKQKNIHSELPLIELVNMVILVLIIRLYLTIRWLLLIGNGEGGVILYKTSHGYCGLFIFITRIFVKSYLRFS